MQQRVHLIFDLGGTLIFDPFEDVISRLAKTPLRERLEAGLQGHVVDTFLKNWKTENANSNFKFASHFLQEDTWISRAAWPMYEVGAIRSRAQFPIWIAEILGLYRLLAVEVIANQGHLKDLRRALAAAQDKKYYLSVASNDRYFAASTMLSAAGILQYFDHVVTSEGLSFRVAGAEKPSRIFFDAFETSTGLRFNKIDTLYIGDDETRDIKSTADLPIRSCRFFGNPSRSSVWVDNARITAADLQFANYSELLALIETGRFETNRST